MKNRVLLLLLLGCQLTVINLHGQSTANKSRPVRDTIGFCRNAEEMNRFIEFLSRNDSASSSSASYMTAAISPHDDYLYAGRIYYPLFKNIRTKEVIIFGVTHSAVRKEMGIQKNVLILDEFKKWFGPYGDVGISPLRELIKNDLPNEYLRVSNRAHELEHSIEAVIPFLQYFNKDIVITPIMVTQMPPGRIDTISSRLSTIIAEYIKSKNMVPGRDIFFLISNDANHYGEDFNNTIYGLDSTAHRLATANDRRIIGKYIEGTIQASGVSALAKEILPDSSNTAAPLWCGRYALLLGLMTITKTVNTIHNETLEGRLLTYSDSYSEQVLPFVSSHMGITAPCSLKHWCGWFSAAIYLK